MIKQLVSMAGLRDLSVAWKWYNDPKYRALESSNSHIHPYYEVYIYISGNVSFLVDHTLYALEKGDVILTAPNQWHHCVYHSDTVHEHFCIVVEGIHDPLPVQTGLIRLPAPARAKMLSVCYEINSHLQAGHPISIREISMIFAVFSYILQGKNEHPSASTMSLEMQAILLHLHSHYNEPLSLSALADQFHISLSTLERQFKKEFNITPFRYLQEIRMSAACSMLEQGRSVLDVSMSCGYNDCSFFINQFRKRFGVTPFQYSKAITRRPPSSGNYRKA